MLKVIQESFKITNENIILATPLIFFSIISSLYLMFSSGGNKIGLIFSAILFFLMLCAFASGWFMMVTKAVKDPEIEDKALLVEFPAGVGEYFLTIIIMIIKIFILSMVIMILAIIAGYKFIGDAGISYAQIVSATSSIESMKVFADSLTNEQLLKINLWNILLFFTIMFTNFIIMFYPASIFFKTKNPFKAFLLALKDTFSHNFFKNIGLFLLIFLIYMIISTVTALFGKNIIVHFLVTLINFYYITFVVVLIFNYYYSNFAKIGSNVDTTV